MASLSLRSRPAVDRAAALRRARQLNRISLGYNATEAAVALIAGWAAGSISLVGFGLDSVVEVSASLVLTWRLAAERRGRCVDGAERVAVRGVAACFALLAIYVAVGSISRLTASERPSTSVVGIALVSVSLVVMPWLVSAKRRVAVDLGSRAQAAEAVRTWRSDTIEDSCCA